MGRYTALLDESLRELKYRATSLAVSFKAVRRVRSAAGVRKYGQPIGTIIRPDAPDLPSVSSRGRSRRVADSIFPGMYKATKADREMFKKKVGRPIPPAWTDVYIAEDLDNAKLLARGKDTKQRWQFIYSAAHTQAQAEAKFKRIKELSKHLDKLDKALERDAMDNDDAAALLLIRRLGMRPGSNADTRAEKKAHGATNLKARHVKLNKDGTVTLDFIGKKGVHIVLNVDDLFIREVLEKRLRTRRGEQQIFNTNESRVRDYMKSTGVPAGFLLKDLRTVRANVIAVEEINKRGDAVPKNKTEFRKWRREVAVAVSEQLGNTPALALSAYINPVVFSKWLVDESWA